MRVDDVEGSICLFLSMTWWAMFAFCPWCTAQYESYQLTEEQVRMVPTAAGARSVALYFDLKKLKPWSRMPAGPPTSPLVVHLSFLVPESTQVTRTGYLRLLLSLFSFT